MNQYNKGVMRLSEDMFQEGQGPGARVIVAN